MCVEEYGVQGFLGDAAKVSKDFPFSCAHLDFTEGLSGENLNTIVQCIKNMATDVGLVGVTIMRGREPKRPVSNSRFRNRNPASMRKALTKAFRKHMRPGIKVTKEIHRRPVPGEQMFVNGKYRADVLIARAQRDVKDMWDQRKHLASDVDLKPCQELAPLFDKKGVPTVAGTTLVRERALLGAVNAALYPEYIINPIWTNGYHSNTDTNGGTPFATVLLAVTRLPIKEGEYRALKVLNRFQKSCDAIRERMKRTEMGGGTQVLFGKTSKLFLSQKLYECYLEEGIEIALQRYDMTKGQFMAYMGTLAEEYEEFSPQYERLKKAMVERDSLRAKTLAFMELANEEPEEGYSEQEKEILAVENSDLIQEAVNYAMTLSCGNSEHFVSSLKKSGFLVDPADEDFRMAAVALASKVGSKEAAQALQVSRGKIAAWLAHATRGTYSQSA
jgi:hypothetical protein